MLLNGIASYKSLYMTCLFLMSTNVASFTSSQRETTALIIASYNGHYSVVKKLLRAGATVNTMNRV